MKKMFAVLLALVMMLSAVSAFAEVSTYMLTGAQDAEGNLFAAAEALMFVIDEETYECAFGAADTLEAGTWEYVTIDENQATLLITFENGAKMYIYFLIAEDCFVFVDENNITYVMDNFDTLQAEAA